MRDITLHNTLTRQKEKFIPIDPENVRMYACGPTVYDFAHLGNARAVVVFDTLYRLLKRHVLKVTYVRNITDVDDKIMAKALETGETIETITRRTTEAFHEDMAALKSLPPDIEPRCTQHIPQMIAMIEKLIGKGHAYHIDGHVLFNVPSMANYGELSRRSRDELVAGARVEVAPYKKDAADFILWKPSTPAQVGWDSPWGRGRPGWHIECSAMAAEHLGTTFDIHGGGLDLIFPHHENEIAQSQCAHDGAPLAKIWMHNGFLTINSDKMSKSLKNFFTVRELLATTPGEALRFTLLSGHYRQPLDFTTESLEKAKATLDRWYGALRGHASLRSTAPCIPPEVEEAMCDDLNTPLAIAHIHEIVSDLNRTTDDAKRLALQISLRSAGAALGLLQEDPEIWFKAHKGNVGGPSDADVDALIADRLAARKAKNFAESDRIRDSLAEHGIILEDGANGTTWRRG